MNPLGKGASMERLILLRHGKAEPDSESGDDFDRRLAPRGVEESAAMAASLADLGFKPDVALVSTSARTRETWDAAVEAFPKAVATYRPDLYNADASAIRHAADQAGETCRTVIVVGHNPGIQELALRLLVEGAAPPGLISRATRNFPPGAAAVFLIDGNGRPHFDGLFYPDAR
jgi:phosphohistidine phosphatase